tara:strand:+ start:28 stop:981 length:954 start_codon:yes stop_codon:yes gene_type:complete
MINKLKPNLFIYIIILNFIFLYSKTFSLEKNYIEVKVNNNIITKSDILNEKKLLIGYNKNLENLSEDELYFLATDSLIRHIIKKEEISKYYDANDEYKHLDKFLNEFYLKINIKDEIDKIKFLEQANLTESEMKDKIVTEALWNEVVYKRYQDKVSIDVENLKQKLQKEIDDLKPTKSYFLSEILYSVVNKDEIIKKNEKILKSIEELGFKNAANIYSISSSAKFGGEIGWIRSSQLSNDVIKKISNLEVNDFTKEPMTVPGGFLILKINDIKEEKIEVNFDDELKKLISFERNRQLNQFSQIYYQKIKKNALINEK